MANQTTTETPLEAAAREYREATQAREAAFERQKRAKKELDDAYEAFDHTVTVVMTALLHLQSVAAGLATS